MAKVDEVDRTKVLGTEKEVAKDVDPETEGLRTGTEVATEVDPKTEGLRTGTEVATEVDPETEGLRTGTEVATEVDPETEGLGTENEVAEEEDPELSKESERETTVNLVFETTLECDRDEKVLRVDADSDIALEVVDAREVVTNTSQTVLRRERENILRRAKQGGH